MSVDSRRGTAQDVREGLPPAPVPRRKHHALLREAECAWGVLPALDAQRDGVQRERRTQLREVALGVRPEDRECRTVRAAPERERGERAADVGALGLGEDGLLGD